MCFEQHFSILEGSFFSVNEVVWVGMYCIGILYFMLTKSLKNRKNVHKMHNTRFSHGHGLAHFIRYLQLKPTLKNNNNYN